MGTFTPGPWHDSKYAGHEGMQDRSIYADSEHAFDLAIVRNGGNDAECAANARLIAAAPDMLESIEGLLGELDRMGLSDTPGDTFADLRNRVDEARDAISQAKGGA